MTTSPSEHEDLPIADLLSPDLVGPRLAEATGDESWKDFSAELIAGGKSNLTFTLRSDAGEVILRRPPTGKLLPSAHDMEREARIQLGLGPTDVPVAQVLLNETTGEDLGVPYYVMEKVVGHVIRDELPAGFAGSDDDKAAMADAQIDALVALHSVDQDAVGLGDLGRPDGYLERQLRRWLGQSEKAHESVRTDRLAELAARLGESMPTSPSSRITHGDYRLDNYVVDPSDPGRILAILDWELSTLGDPVADLAQTVLYWGDPDGPTVPLIPSLTTETGWPGPDRLLERYCAATGTDPSEMPWYLAFATFKFAAIAQGVATRSLAGDMAGQDFGDIGPQIRDLVDHGHSILDSRKGTSS
ncbi:acyl-CoA dehydrogenase [Dietzia sp. NCCP-2495]|uniref:phosphotransferase family protein n=1 Tax=Dietzia sp. NCCP-2495 TaxID=2934675 RepID=UPI00222E485A|nr:phosphotransferase family protein [Dietzia sp. NCCP-2495]GLB63922.1 acyl-CoA dehydrogenase [Dietzia sp. NCCP-2495]